MMRYQKLIIGLSLSLTLTTLNACTTAGDDSVRQLQAPTYATRTGAETYNVTCGGGSNITIRRSSMDDFYHANGSMKSLTEFCEEFDPASLIQR